MTRTIADHITRYGLMPLLGLWASARLVIELRGFLRETREFDRRDTF